MTSGRLCRRICFCSALVIQFAEALQSWLVSLSLQAEYLTPVSFVEIFLGFSVFTKVSLPICVDSTSQHWMDVAGLEAGDLFGRTLAAQVSVFRLWFDAVLQAVDCSFENDSGLQTFQWDRDGLTGLYSAMAGVGGGQGALVHAGLLSKIPFEIFSRPRSFMALMEACRGLTCCATSLSCVHSCGA